MRSPMIPLRRLFRGLPGPIALSFAVHGEARDYPWDQTGAQPPWNRFLSNTSPRKRYFGRLLLFAAVLLASEWASDTNTFNIDASLLLRNKDSWSSVSDRREENIGYKDALLALSTWGDCEAANRAETGERVSRKAVSSTRPSVVR
jgi:hypothetical protein